MRKIVIFFSANCTCSTRLQTSAGVLAAARRSLQRETAPSPGDHCAFQTAQHTHEIQGIKDQTESVLGSFYFVRRDDRVHEWFSARMCRRLSYRCWKLLSLSVPAVSTDCHTCAGNVTGSHSSCSHQFSPDFSDLVSWALAGSLWPPNASLWFCQKEVLMLLGWRFRVEICLDKWVAECLGCWPALLPSPWASCHTRALRCQRQSRLGRRGTLLSFHSPRWGAN